MTQIILIATLLILAGILIGRLWKSASNAQPGTAERLLNNAFFRTYSLTIIYLVVGLPAALYLVNLVITKQVTDAGVSALIGGAVMQILNACLLTPSGFNFGSSEGSRLKDTQ